MNEDYDWTWQEEINMDVPNSRDPVSNSDEWPALKAALILSAVPSQIPTQSLFIVPLIAPISNMD